MKYKAIAKDKIHTGDLFYRLTQGIAYLKENPIIFVFGIASYMLFAFTLHGLIQVTSGTQTPYWRV